MLGCLKMVGMFRSKDEVAKPHDRVGGEEQAERPERAKRHEDHGGGHDRPADPDVEDVVDRVAVVLAVLATNRSNREPAAGLAAVAIEEAWSFIAEVPSGSHLPVVGSGVPGHLRRDSLVDLRVRVLVEAVVDDLAPVRRELELRRVVLVVAAEAEPVLVGLLGGDRAIGLRDLGSSGSATCFEAGPWQFSHWLPFR